MASLLSQQIPVVSPRRLLACEQIQERRQRQGVHDVLWLDPATASCGHCVHDRVQGCNVVCITDDGQRHAQLESLARMHVIQIQTVGIHLQDGARFSCHLQDSI